MIRFLPLLLLPLLSAPAMAAGLSPEALAKQNHAIAVSVQQQLLSCWSLPPGETGQRLSLDIAFFGDGRLDGLPILPPGDAKRASKGDALLASVLSAVESCVPFEGLEALGAAPDERFSVTITFAS